MEQWQLWCERFSQLQLREKWLIAVSSLVLTLWLAFNYALEPGWQSGQKLQQQHAQMQRQLIELRQQTEQFRSQLSVDQDAGYRQQIAELQQQQRQLNEQIRQNASHFIAAEQMLPLLQDMLQSSGSVQLKRLSSAPAQAVRLDGQTEQDETLLYQHRLTMVMAGRYPSLQQVLKQLEQLPWLINWAELQYRVEQYPQGELRLELLTVSENEDIIRL